MIPDEILTVLKFIVEEFEKYKFKWVVAGSLSLALQGVDVTPKDIDIITTKDVALQLNTLWKEYIVREVSYGETSHYRSYFGIFRISGVNVEVMGDLEERRNDKWVSLMHRLQNPTIITINNIKVPVSPLEDQLESYRKSKRHKDIEKAEKIEKAIKK